MHRGVGTEEGGTKAQISISTGGTRRGKVMVQPWENVCDLGVRHLEVQIIFEG